MKLRITELRSGEVLLERELGDNEILDIDALTRAWSQSNDYPILACGGVPAGLADVDVALTDDPDSVRVWQSRSYFLNHQTA